MRRRAVTIFLIAALFALSGCGGGVFFLSTDGNNVTLLSVSGTVSITQLVIINGNQVTIVTLVNTGLTQNFNFCGNMVDQFPAGVFVTVTFKQGGTCSSVTQVQQQGLN